MIVLDYIVLSFLKNLWKVNIERIQKSTFNVNIMYALFTYILLVFGLYYFVYKNINKSKWKFDSLIKGFLFGFIVYGVFDFTNLAIFKDYSLKMAIIDMIWGGILMSIVSFTTYYFSEIYN
jgi:uncharacterized membrane protein